MAYTPINWDEFTPITATNLDKMDSEIDSNESRITTNESDISDIEDGTTKVGSADNADSADIADTAVNALSLNGENWEVVAEGNLTGSGTIDLLPAQNHYKYNYSVYSPDNTVIIGPSEGGDRAYIRKNESGNDELVIAVIGTDTFHYKVWVLR